MIYIDDSIMQKGCLATAGSKMLENFKAPFDATVITRLTGEIKRVKCAEFGLSDPGELPGAPMLCNDVFGYVRKRAAKQGLCYIRPTYGTVSRFGLIPTAASMDQIGVVCKTLSEGFELLSAIAGHDPNDGAMFPEERYDYKPSGGRVKKAVDLPLQDACDPVLRILAYAEICNNISRYDGIKFGYCADSYRTLDELYTRTRTEAFGLEAKLAAIVGVMVLSHEHYAAYYDKAMRIRRLIKESVTFDEYDVLELSVDSPLAVLCGLPSVTVNGVQLVANVKNEGALLKAVGA